MLIPREDEPDIVEEYDMRDPRHRQEPRATLSTLSQMVQYVTYLGLLIALSYRVPSLLALSYRGT